MCHSFSTSYLVNPCSFFRNCQKLHAISASFKVVPESSRGILEKKNYYLNRRWHPVTSIQVADSWGGFWQQRKLLARWSMRIKFLMTSQSVQLSLPEEPIRSNYLMTSQFYYPGQNIQSEETSWQLCQSNFLETLESLRGSRLAGGHGRRDSNWVVSWRNLSLFCGEGMS
jgi:hypothetical protein